jgi:hypothetical protein
MNHQRKYSKKSTFSKVLIVILLICIALAAYAIATEINRAHAETVYAKQWIMCKDYVLIRMGPSRKSPEVGQLDPADEIEIDGKTKDGFAHIVSPVDGWVWAGNIVDSKPEKIDGTGYVIANKRLYCRRWIDGPTVEEKPYVINGSEVKVFWIGGGWALTNRGYLQSEWLEVEY